MKAQIQPPPPQPKINRKFLIGGGLFLGLIIIGIIIYFSLNKKEDDTDTTTTTEEETPVTTTTTENVTSTTCLSPKVIYNGECLSPGQVCDPGIENQDPNGNYTISSDGNCLLTGCNNNKVLNNNQCITPSGQVCDPGIENQDPDGIYRTNAVGGCALSGCINNKVKYNGQCLEQGASCVPLTLDQVQYGTDYTLQENQCKPTGCTSGAFLENGACIEPRPCQISDLANPANVTGVVGMIPEPGCIISSCEEGFNITGGIVGEQSCVLVDQVELGEAIQSGNYSLFSNKYTDSSSGITFIQWIDTGNVEECKQTCDQNPECSTIVRWKSDGDWEGGCEFFSGAPPLSEVVDDNTMDLYIKN